MHFNKKPIQDNKRNTVTTSPGGKRTNRNNIFQLIDNRPETIAQRRIQRAADNSPQVRQLMAIRELVSSDRLVPSIPQRIPVAQFTDSMAKSTSEKHSSQSSPPVLQRSLLRNIHKKTVGGFNLQEKGTAPAEETEIQCWQSLVAESEPNSHSVLWFSYTEDDSQNLGKVHWTGDGFQMIFSATKDGYYVDQGSETKASTVAMLKAKAKEHIDETKASAPKGGLQSHCHAFVISLYDKL